MAEKLAWLAAKYRNCLDLWLEDKNSILSGDDMNSFLWRVMWLSGEHLKLWMRRSGIQASPVTLFP